MGFQQSLASPWLLRTFHGWGALAGKMATNREAVFPTLILGLQRKKVPDSQNQDTHTPLGWVSPVFWKYRLAQAPQQPACPGHTLASGALLVREVATPSGRRQNWSSIPNLRLGRKPKSLGVGEGSIPHLRTPPPPTASSIRASCLLTVKF